MQKRIVTHARFHESLFISGVGSLGDSLPSQSKTLQLEMCREPGGDLEVKINGQEYAIPLANIKIVKYAPLPAAEVIQLDTKKSIKGK